MDAATRNILRNTVTRCRQILESALGDELEGKFGIHARGQVDNEDALPLTDEADRQARRQLVESLDHIQSRGFMKKDSVEQLVREAAFTHLNRICALKMMEKRGLIREAVSRGAESQGFFFYRADHPQEERLCQAGQQHTAYRHYLEWLGQQLSGEVQALFWPEDPANRLFPSANVLQQILGQVNSPGLADIWDQDEAIGWVYQYFTPKELRDRARKESPAPRNSYELAFRNQFYTPRYVVEFLVDNTLGRTWWEMRQGQTALAEKCRYLVHRKQTVFLQPGATGHPDSQPADEASLEMESVPYRPKKEPTWLRILDPACGSGHFLLYCFDLLQIIYEEAYDDPDLGPNIRADHPDREEYRRAIPGLILKNNLYGIDIDLRATQIASLALWLKARRAWGDSGRGNAGPANLSMPGAAGVGQVCLPRAHIVCAEPMPGEEELRAEFLAGLDPPALQEMVRAVFEKMRLAGEAGSLLKVEGEIAEAAARARKKFRPEQLLLPGLVDTIALRPLDPKSEEAFWAQADQHIIQALHEYAAHAANGHGYLRRLFAGDAERGMGFVEVCRNRYDVVLMNPPFGAASTASRDYIGKAYPRTKNDVFAAFVERGLGLLHPHGLLGAITSRTGFFLTSFQKWREEILLKEARLAVMADLGAGVLDSAMVETAAYVLEASHD